MPDTLREAPGRPASYSGAPARRPRRILLLEANEDGTVGGSHQILHDLSIGMDRRRYEPVVVFYQENIFAARLRERGVEVHVFDAMRKQERSLHQRGRLIDLPAAYLGPIARRIRFLRKHRIDLIHVNNSPKVGGDDWLPASRIVRIPCIANAVGDARGEQHPIKRLLFRSFDHVIPCSQYLADAMVRAGYAPARMDLVYPGVDIEAFRERARRSREEVRAELGIAPDVVLASMVGNVREWKGQHVVLSALERLAPSVRDKLHVMFIGAATPADEPFRRALAATVMRAGLERVVSFLGARLDVPDLVNAADLAIHASVKPEPFGLVVVEAMALGKPVIGASTGGPAEVLTPECGITHDVQDPGELARALTRLVNDPAERARLGANALIRVEEFSVRRTIEGTERVYQRFLAD
ncbi:MAG TPA: glycosyltransferase family 4 protein [Gemmatimonadaceae bacterium]|nr:glycosyltransferase family 4 protein [Gemmatimonadaceae bacterium]